MFVRNCGIRGIVVSVLSSCGYQLCICMLGLLAGPFSVLFIKCRYCRCKRAEQNVLYLYAVLSHWSELVIFGICQIISDEFAHTILHRHAPAAAPPAARRAVAPAVRRVVAKPAAIAAPRKKSDPAAIYGAPLRPKQRAVKPAVAAAVKLVMWLSDNISDCLWKSNGERTA